jgi:hypothetical protein
MSAFDPYHSAEAAKAKALYIAGRDAPGGSMEWRAELRYVRKMVADTLRVSKYLTDISGALRISSAHMGVFRQLTAPPLSQDQFALLCKGWSKGRERKPGPVKAATAEAAAAVVGSWLDTAIAPWLAANRLPRRAELRRLFLRAGTLMAAQRLQTGSRKKSASGQEGAVVELLLASGWTKLPSKLIDTRAAVPPKHFMHKTRFATKSAAAQEVDVACGLAGTYVLAMECKVTNDETNSVKRVNDVLKKATAWREHWGSFVHTAALLQGVLAPKDVQRLLDAGVVVFWSHDLDAFSTWLGEHV